MSRGESLLLAVALAIMGAVLGASVERLAYPSRTVQAVHPSRDSIVAATALSRAALAEYASQVAQADGDDQDGADQPGEDEGGVHPHHFHPCFALFRAHSTA